MIFASKLKNEKNLIVCDPFLGSGSAAIADLKNNCNFIGGDISKTAIKISKERIDTYLKKKIDILEIISVADVFGESMKRIVEGTSLSSMFQGF